MEKRKGINKFIIQNMEKNKELQLFCYTHKIPVYGLEDDAIHTPIQVGKAYNVDKNICKISDNTDDNIGFKNKWYRELTGMYWVWKNALNAKYIGCEHYRRRWDLQKNDVVSLLEKYDIITFNKIYTYYTLEKHYEIFHSSKDIHLIEDIIKEKYPEYIESYDKFIKNGHCLYPANCFISTKENYSRICEFIFGILDEFDKRAGITNEGNLVEHVKEYSVNSCPEDHKKNEQWGWIKYQEGIDGFLSERLTTLYILHNFKEEKIYETYPLEMEKRTLLCGIGRWENDYIREWVEHYKNLGFTNICLYDNNRDGEEHFEEVIGDYIDNGFVILKDYRNKQKCQNIAYQECYNEYGKDYDWIVFFDIDEFLEIKNYKTISEYLSYVSQFNPDMIHLNWMIYGDENKPIDYNKNIGYGFPENNHIKTIVKTGKNIDWIRSSNPHAPFSQGLKCVNNKGDICDANSPFNPYDYTEAYLKHYSTKTAKEYARKMKRGFPDQMWDGSRIKNLVETRFFRTNEVTQEKVDIFKEELGLDFSYLLKRTNMDKRKDVQIFNLCYSKKDYAFKEDSVITPLQVGAANGTDVCELKDNTGDNISAGNFFYIENTGTYWIWRNVKDAKYKGQFQYRRPLEGINEETDFEKIFSEYDVITCVPFNHPANSKPTKENPMCIPAKTVEGGYAFSNCLYDLLAMESVVKSMFPDYASDWDKYIKKGENLYYSSGFIMRAEDYDRYSEFLFRCFNGWLQKAEIQTPLDLYYHVGKNVGMGGYEMRYPNMSMPKEAIKWQSEIGGFIGERLWTLWLQHNFPQEKIYKVPYVKQEEGMYT